MIAERRRSSGGKAITGMPPLQPAAARRTPGRPEDGPAYSGYLPGPVV
jgi:hypothetical protein